MSPSVIEKLRVPIDEEFFKEYDAGNSQVDEAPTKKGKKKKKKKSVAVVQTVQDVLNATNSDLMTEFASVTMKNPRTFQIILFDEDYASRVERVIRETNYDLNPSRSQLIIDVPVPKVTKEVKDALVENAKKLAIESRNYIDNLHSKTYKRIQRIGQLANKDDAKMLEADLTKLT
eukprot:CAMPEP_0117421120 /NCGR_PEP_ID=MMETSP0758-20121206/2294_1 /TAXON_ID=63605 /ORGANISM="Percolomonas cosmopolitus, Strain AE-1 (ATCC 50343)" /LENGTH=174 /DNA_ID=CAMNT_0005203091 /DNA_START=215 /DNA_END=736 /DNA_ORIENTATION=-